MNEDRNACAAVGKRNFVRYKPSLYNYDQLHTSHDLEYCRSYVSFEKSLCALHHPIKGQRFPSEQLLYGFATSMYQQ